MIPAFTFRAPTAALFGCGSRARVTEMLPSARCGLLSSPSVAAKPEVLEILASCSRAGIEISMLGTVSPNPRLSEVRDAFEVARAEGIESILAIGGGSVLDAAKLLRVSVRYRTDPALVLGDTDAVVAGEPTREVDLLAMPTTAGTGAEVSAGAIITDDVSDPTAHVKKAARGPELVPSSAVVDPELALTLPRRRTAETGFDVICHAIETLLSRRSNPLTDSLARSALREVPEALRSAYADGADLEARETLALHAWLMGYNLAHASTCLPHRMQYPVGSLTDTSHQIGLAAIYPAWIRRLQRSRPELAMSVAAFLAPPGADVDDPEETVRTFLDELGLLTGLKALGILENQLVELTDSVTGRIDLDPIDPARDDILEIFEAAFD